MVEIHIGIIRSNVTGLPKSIRPHPRVVEHPFLLTFQTYSQYRLKPTTSEVMRVSILSILSLTLALANFVSGHSDDAHRAREYVDDLSVRETSTDVLADISTRDLISELSEHLERRKWGTPHKLMNCPHCTRQFVVGNNLDEHIMGEHSLPNHAIGQAVKCPHCDRLFYAHNNLVEHIRMAHSRDRRR
ncbi:hypothetical protein DFP72DRAFT_898206 [Ephemerocybe angulata]|uniref:C2H2-type domain-containing protein n=1 Tax=Ephemerocybe angulata TaxID=980116 RepID=A0A8H6M6Q7_9AGAR|nr:hypothetical protein DFP72DRAFT_898206 [Tulosesus angulatus]